MSSSGRRLEIDFDALLADQFDRPVDDGQRLQAEEVELHEAGRLGPFHVELAGRNVRPRIAVEADQLHQRPVADDDAGGVGRGVAIEAFELLRRLEEVGDLFFFLDRLLELRLHFKGIGQRRRVGGVERHQLGQLVDLAERKLQHAADIAQHGARLQRAECDDLRDAIRAIFLAHVLDDFAAPLLAEVDVEVGHRHAFGVEEALEQQAEADGIEVGDGQRPGDNRTCARTPARPHRNAVRLRPLDEVRDDKEVARKSHVLDDAELVGQPFVVDLPLGIELAGRAAAP